MFFFKGLVAVCHSFCIYFSLLFAFIFRFFSHVLYPYPYLPLSGEVEHGIITGLKYSIC
jgi:hypothetical protein